MRLAILLCAFALAASAPITSLDESELLGTDDCTVMQNAFIQGQRGLIAEFKVATLAVANTVLPGFEFDISVSTTTAHPNTNATCPNPPPEFPLFILNQFQVSGVVFAFGSELNRDKLAALWHFQPRAAAIICVSDQI